MKIIALIAVAGAAFYSSIAETMPLAGQDAAVAAARSIADHTYAVDTGHSRVVFKIKHANASWFYGTLGGLDGSLTIDPAKPEAGKVELKIAIAGIDTDDDKRDEHLRGPDFFDAKQFPEITFVSTKIKQDGEALAIDGELTMLGRKRPLSMKALKTGEGEFYGKRIGYETTFTIKRSDFGMKYGVAEKALGDEVTLMVGIEGVQAGK